MSDSLFVGWPDAHPLRSKGWVVSDRTRFAWLAGVFRDFRPSTRSWTPTSATFTKGWREGYAAARFGKFISRRSASLMENKAFTLAGIVHSYSQVKESCRRAMLYWNEAGKIRTRGVEFAAADHCNLRCAGCSHMSPFVRSRLPGEDELARDMGRLATAMFADEVRILGGEPLLNPRIVAILKAAKESGIAGRVVLTTNGLLLHTMPHEFWDNVDEVRLSLYPGARPAERLVEQARKMASESATELVISEWSEFRVTMVTEPHPPDAITAMIFRTCKNAHLHHCHMVREGWLYKCACPSYLNEFLGNMGRAGYEAESDGFDIHGAADLRKQLWDFLTNDRTLDACRYCLGYVGNKQAHHQLTIKETRDAVSQPITRETHLSKTALTRESLKYFGRRASEAITRKSRW